MSCMRDQYTGTWVRINGQALGVTTSTVNVWDNATAWTPLTAESALKVSSSSDTDKPASTGAWTVQVHGLDANGNYQNEIVTLDGTTAVDMTKKFTQVYGLEVLTVGSGGVSVGNIYVSDSGTITAGVPQTASGIRCKCLAGEGSTYNGFFEVPAGMRYRLTMVEVNAGKVCTVHLKSRRDRVGEQLITRMALEVPSGATHVVPFQGQEMIFKAGEVIQLTALAAASGTNVRAMLCLERVI